MMKRWPFPPRTREVQFDEKWSFVACKKKTCEGDDERRGDHWDHVAFDAENRLVVSLVAGKRTKKNTNRLVADFKCRTNGRVMRLMSSDEYKPYRDAILREYADRVPQKRRFARGRHPYPKLVPPKNLVYIAVHKYRRKGRVVRVTNRLIYGTQEGLQAALAASRCSGKPNIAFVERYNATDRHFNSRKVRRTYRFSKDWDLHEAVSWFALGLYNFCRPVRTLGITVPSGRRQARTPAMSAELADCVWSLDKWIHHPVKFHLVA